MKKNPHLIFCISLFFLIYSKGYTQNNIPVFTQYMYNPITINPAYSDNQNSFTIFGLHRNQWQGIEGAPKTYIVSINSSINRKKMKLGFSAIHDIIGPEINTNFNIDYSYALDLSYDLKLNLGLKLGINHQRFNFNGFEAFEANDPLFENDGKNILSPNLGIGTYLSNNKFYIGLSIINLFAHRPIGNNTDTSISNSGLSVFNFIGGHVFNISPNIKLKPAILIKYATDSQKTQTDLSLNTLFIEKFSLGISYRLNASISGLVGFTINEKTMLGFSYERDTTDLAQIKNNNGSFEFFAKFKILKSSYKRVLTPRYF